MRKRILCLTVVCAMLFPIAACAAADTPTRSVWCRGLKRLQSAVDAGREIEWTISLHPTQMAGLTEGALLLAQQLSFEGSTYAAENGGGMDIRLLFLENQILSVSAESDADWTALTLDDQTLLTQPQNAAQTADDASLGALGALLLCFDYAKIGQTPYLSPAYSAGMTLWGLASPYSSDTNRLSVGSGATSHALVYEIDTDGLRAILSGFIAEYKDETLLLPGISGEAQGDFWNKARDYALHAEVSSPLKASLVFGEGDLLRSAKLTGTIRMNGKSTPLSYTYSCSVSNTRLTRKYSLSFQPSGGDTVSLSATYLTSCSGKGGAQRQISIRMSGKYDGQAYAVSLEEKTVNKYAIDDERVLHETLTGEISAQVKYGGQKIAVISGTHEGVVATNKTDLAQLDDTFCGSLLLNGETVFDGEATISLRAGSRREAPAIPPDAQNDAAALAAVWENAAQKLISLLPDELLYRISVSD